MATLQTNEIESESQSTVGGKPAKYFPTIQFQVIIVFSCNFTFVHDLIIILSFSAHIHDAHKTYHNDII